MTENNRNYGIDLLRLIAITFVVLQHVLTRGGILEAAEVGSSQYAAATFLEMLSYCSVSIFALISGYVGYTEEPRPFRVSKYVSRWLQVVFYCVLLTIAGIVWTPQLALWEDLRRDLFPVVSNQYWYFTSYTALFFLIPLLNAGIRNTSDNALKKLFCVMFLMFSVCGTFFKIFLLDEGRAPMWLIICYLMGATIKKCSLFEKWSNRYLLLGITLCCVLSWLWSLFVPVFTVLGIEISNDTIRCYQSPFNVMAAACYVTLFSRIKVKDKWHRLLNQAVPGILSVYILNRHIVIWTRTIKNTFASLANMPVWNMIPRIVIFSVLFVLLGLIIDLGRRKIFDAVRRFLVHVAGPAKSKY